MAPCAPIPSNGRRSSSPSAWRTSRIIRASSNTSKSVSRDSARTTWTPSSSSTSAAATRRLPSTPCDGCADRGDPSWEKEVARASTGQSDTSNAPRTIGASGSNSYEASALEVEKESATGTGTKSERVEVEADASGPPTGVGTEGRRPGWANVVGSEDPATPSSSSSPDASPETLADLMRKADEDIAAMARKCQIGAWRGITWRTPKRSGVSFPRRGARRPRRRVHHHAMEFAAARTPAVGSRSAHHGGVHGVGRGTRSDAGGAQLLAQSRPTPPGSRTRQPRRRGHGSGREGDVALNLILFLEESAAVETLLPSR